MSAGLKYGRKAAAAGKATSMVVFVHGYGADGADLLGLGDALAPHLPGAVFLAPDAPQPCVGNPFGFQWTDRRRRPRARGWGHLSRC